MNNAPIPFALREARKYLTHRVMISGMAGAALILGLSGPFDTLEHMRLLPRLAYWGCVVVTTFALGCFISALCSRLTRDMSGTLRFVLTSLAIGVAVSCLLFVINTAVFGGFYTDLWDWAETLVTVIFIAAAIEGGIAFATATSTHPPAALPPIVKRLPHGKRGALIALSATDHYVEVRTTGGKALILMRLADAIAEAGDVGLQVHRSHWVAHDQVTSAVRKGDRAVLKMTDGGEIPVSRSYLPAARDAGLLGER